MFLKTQAGMLALVLSAATGCGACSAEVPAADAGFDAGVDLGRDAGADAGRRDAGTDAGRDAGSDTDAAGDPLWTALPEHETGCVIEYARNPQAVYTPTWIACPDGMPAGCERLDMPMGVVIDADVLGPEMRMFVGVPEAMTGGDVVVLASHDAALLAVRSPEAWASALCQTGFEATGDRRAVFTTWTTTDDRHYDERHYVIDEAANEWTAPSVRINRLLATSAQQLEISASTYVAVLSASMKLEVYEDGRSNTLRGLGTPQTTFLVGRDVFWEDWTGGYVVRIYHGTVDGPGTVFFATPDGSDLKGFATDGIDMAWTQAYGVLPGGVTFERYELWTAPYTTDPTLLAPRRVAIEVYQGVGAVGSGWYARGSDASGAVEFVRLADGARKLLPALGEGFAYNQRPTLGNGQVSIRARRRAVGRFETTLVLMPIDAIPDV